MKAHRRLARALIVLTAGAGLAAAVSLPSWADVAAGSPSVASSPSPSSEDPSPSSDEPSPSSDEEPTSTEPTSEEPTTTAPTTTTSEPSSPACVEPGPDSLTYTFTHDPASSTVTLTFAVADGVVLCDEATASLAFWTYDQPESGIFPQTYDSSAVVTVGPEQTEDVAVLTGRCGQFDAYANAGPGDGDTLTGPGTPYAETFITSIASGSSTTDNPWYQTPADECGDVEPGTVAPSATLGSECGTDGLVATAALDNTESTEPVTFSITATDTVTGTGLYADDVTVPAGETSSSEAMLLTGDNPVRFVVTGLVTGGETLPLLDETVDPVRCDELPTTTPPAGQTAEIEYDCASDLQFGQSTVLVTLDNPETTERSFTVRITDTAKQAGDEGYLLYNRSTIVPAATPEANGTGSVTFMVPWADDTIVPPTPLTALVSVSVWVNGQTTVLAEETVSGMGCGVFGESTELPPPPPGNVGNVPDVGGNSGGGLAYTGAAVPPMQLIGLGALALFFGSALVLLARRPKGGHS